MTAQNLSPTRSLDFTSATVQAFVEEAIQTGSVSPEDRAVDLYYAVRDRLHYEVYATDISARGLTASTVISTGQGFCLHKSIVYAAAVRAVGIPSRILCASVRNHLSSPGLQSLVGGTTFLHWFSQVFIGDRWIKATPVFNALLCKMYGIEPLEFDGRADSIFHPAGDAGAMEFLGEPLSFDDVDPVRFRALIADAHPRMVTDSGLVPGEGRLIAEEIPADPKPA